MGYIPSLSAECPIARSMRTAYPLTSNRDSLSRQEPLASASLSSLLLHACVLVVWCCGESFMATNLAVKREQVSLHSSSCCGLDTLFCLHSKPMARSSLYLRVRS